MSSNRCPGSFFVSNGVATRPGCVFCNGAVDEILRPPQNFQNKNSGFQPPRQTQSSSDSIIFSDA